MSTLEKQEIDEGLYSRQLFVLGKEAMLSLGESNVLLVGLGGLGVEIAKNIALAGVKSLTLLDNTAVKWGDLSSNYYLKESDVGNVSRAKACYSKLVELNSHVDLKLKEDSKTGDSEASCADYSWAISSKALKDIEFLREFQVIILTECGHDYDFMVQFNETCREHGLKLIIANSYGVCGQVFCDLGDHFYVKDANGEDPVTLPIANIEQKGEDTLIHLMERHFYRLFEGDLVTFRGIHGMEELNGAEHRIKEIVDLKTLSIGKTEATSQYISGGTLIEAKVRKEMHFKSYANATDSNSFLVADMVKDMIQQFKLHLMIRALSKFYADHGRLPLPWNEDDANQFSCLVEEFNLETMKGVDVEINYRKYFSYTCQGNIAPMQAIIGGFAAQEAVKACTGKFVPLHQWLYVDFFESLPEHVGSDQISPTVCSKRFTGQIEVFGENIQQHLQQSSWFVVGAGAIGCEMLKNFAMMGIASKEEMNDGGKVFVTDMDSIERSNLNRQFLFRNDNIGKNKAIVAAAAVKEMNANFNVIPHINKVGPETEHIYTDEFYSNLTGLANALDNVEARKYTNDRSHYYLLPLLESGTQGTRAHTQMIVPHVTSGYDAPGDARDTKIAICTLKNFPYLIHHTIQWARDLFEGLFAQTSRLARRFLDDRDSLLRQISTLPYHEALDSLKKVHSTLANPPSSEEDCIKWARILWQEYYYNNIVQLLHNYPPDHEIDGMLFWSSDKRMPHPLDFNALEDLHLHFIQAAASIRAHMFGIQHHFHDASFVKNCVAGVTVPEFTVDETLRIGSNDKEEAAIVSSQLTSLQEQVENLREELLALDVPTRLNLHLVEFEKDDDTNYHIDFITAASNLRALNYGIDPVDRLKTKGIAGRIIPAIATTTAIVTGLICMEIYKLFNGPEDKEKYREMNLELANPSMLILHCSSPKQLENTSYNEWSVFTDPEIRNMTLRKFMEYFEEKHNCPLDGVMYGKRLLFPRLSTPEEDEKVLEMEMKQLVEYVQQQPLENFRRSIAFDLISRDDDVEVLPKAVYRLE
jgi:ubiquitin-activating enzyme E1